MTTTALKTRFTELTGLTANTLNALLTIDEAGCDVSDLSTPDGRKKAFWVEVLISPNPSLAHSPKMR